MHLQIDDSFKMQSYKLQKWVELGISIRNVFRALRFQCFYSNIYYLKQYFSS